MFWPGISGNYSQKKLNQTKLNIFKRRKTDKKKIKEIKKQYKNIETRMKKVEDSGTEWEESEHKICTNDRKYHKKARQKKKKVSWT